MRRTARIPDLEPDAEEERFVEALDAAIRGNSDESLDTLFDRAALDQAARRAAIASVHDKFGPAALLDDRDVARVALRKAVLCLLDMILEKAGEPDR